MTTGRAFLCGLALVSATSFGCDSDVPAVQRDARDVLFEVDDSLSFEHVNGMSGELYSVEIIGAGAALLDYDSDGDMDALLRQGGSLSGDASAGAPTDRLLRNDPPAQPGQGRRFTDVTRGSGLDVPGYGMGVATGDYDNDGRVDLYLTNFGPNRLLHNEGDGVFSDATARTGTDDPRWSVPAVFFDYDRDGWLDLYVGNYVDFSVESHKPCYRPSSARDYCGPTSYAPEPDRLFRNLGDGTFEDVTAPAGLAASYGNALGAVAADFDADGWLDLYVANDAMDNALWINRRDGTFEDVAVLAGCAVNGNGEREGSMGLAVDDYDADGDVDIFITHLATETHTLYRNEGDGTFQDVTVIAGLAAPTRTATGFGTGWIDYDHDGWLDILAVNGAVFVDEEQERAGDPHPLRQPDQLFRNLGDGRFEEVTDQASPALAVPDVSRGAAFGDLDDDGDADVIVTNNDGPARLLVNQVGSRTPWLGLRLVTGTPPRDALGARVGILRRGGPALWRRVGTDGSYASAGDPRVRVGLGDDGAVSGLEVRWTSGAVESFPAPPPGRYSVIAEGTGRPLR